jgi:transporter, SSS family
MNVIEITLFFVAIITVIGFGIWQSRDESDAAEAGASGYFLAGRGLTWWLVGFSLIAANISTEQFVGMSGSAANWLGMAIASYEWMAAITLIGVAFWFLPRFLRAGIYTIPEFLEYRFGVVARLAMAILTIAILVLVPTATVIFSGAKFVSEYYNTVPVLSNLTAAGWIIAIFAAVYVFIGGLKACAWTDLVWGSGLIIGGALVMWFAFGALAEKSPEDLIATKVQNSEATVEDLAQANAWERLLLLNDGKNGEAVVRNGENLSGGKLHMVRPKEDSQLPWTALLVGLWIPNFFYWGLNQYIVQRTLGSKSLAEGQRGIVFAAFLKLIIPFVVVIPGILAFNLFSEHLMNASGQYDYDKAFPVLVRELIKPHPMISWFVIAALFGAVVSSLASMLNSASTIATMDLYQKATGEKDQRKLVVAGRVFVVIFVLIAALTAPLLSNPNLGGIFNFIQEFQGFMSPGILAVFLVGFFVPRAPRYVGVMGIVLNVVFYGLIKWVLGPWIVAKGWWFAPEISFLDRMAICFFIVLIASAIATIVTPMERPVEMPENKEIPLESSPIAKLAGFAVVIATITLYFIFW